MALLGARGLRASKKNACNPFAVVYVGKTQLKSTRKDGAFSPCGMSYSTLSGRWEVTQRVFRLYAWCLKVN